MLSPGDEFQALHLTFVPLVRDAVQITPVVYPYPIRFSLCRGELNTAVKPDTARAWMDRLFMGYGNR